MTIVWIELSYLYHLLINNIWWHWNWWCHLWYKEHDHSGRTGYILGSQGVNWWFYRNCMITSFFNPSTPMPALTARDEPWPFFHFRRHHFWLKLASSMLNFCRRKRSFQWCPDQSDRSNGAWDMHKNAQKVEWKTHSKISCHYTHGYSLVKFARLVEAFLEVF